MWIVYAILFVVGYAVVHKGHSMTEQIAALRAYATDLLLQPERHRANAAELRETMLRLANDPRAAEKAVARALQQWAAEAKAALMVLLCLVGLACRSGPSDVDAAAGIDSLNARITQAYRTHDPKAYGALYTDSAVFEWPAFNTVRGARALEQMAQENWASLKDMDLRLIVSTRRFAPSHATEFGAFEQSYTDASGKRSIEYGRYVAVVVRQSDGRWLMERFFGFGDSTRAVSGHVGQ